MNLLELFVKIGVDDSGLESGLSDAESKSESAGSKIASALGGAAKVGAAAIATIGTSTVAAGTALVNGAKNVAEYGDNIDKMSQKMGISAEAYQEWDAVLQHSGTSIDSMSRGMQTLQKNAVNSADKFEKLGISQEQLASMSTEDLFAATIEGLQNMGEGAERTALASELLGGSAKELGALLNTSAADTQAMKDRVHELGGVMSDEAVKNAAAFQDQLQDMQTGFQSLSRNLLSDFMPSLTTVMSGLTDIFSGDEGGISKVSEGIDTLINGITNALPNLLNIGSQIVMSIGTAITNNLPKLLTTGADIILTLTKSFIQNLPQIVKSGMEAIISLAKGIADALPDLIPAVVDAVLTIVDVLLDNIDLLIDAGIELTLGLAEGLIEALPKLIEKAPVLIEKLLQALVRNAPKIADAGLKLIEMLGKALVTNIPKLISKVPQVISSLVSAFIGALGAIANIGTHIVQGIWNGIVSATSWLKNKITGWVGDVVSFLKNLFGIHSPSTVMRDVIGKNLALGVWAGWDDENPIDRINSDIESIEQPTMTAKAGLTSQTVSDQSQSEQKSFLTEDDLMRILEALSITLYNITEIDGKEIKKDSYKYTLNRLNDETRAVRLATGG
jgi:phage-related protein